ncbi:MAG: extracellular solute-binding protein, partial [Clostridia bacterium]|nr:extracellular solute-binding protein [Clostridia bacterium]
NVFEISGTGTAVGMEFEVAISEDGKTILGAGTIGAPDDYYAAFPAPYNTNTRSERAVNKLTKWAQYTQPNSVSEDDVANNLFYTGLVAAQEGNISGYENNKREIEKIEGAKLGMFIYDDNLRNMVPGFYHTSGQTAWNFLCVPYYSKNVDAAMKFIDWIFQSEENHDLFELGLVGEDFTLNENGEYAKLNPDNLYSFPGYEMTWNPNFIRTNAELDEDVKVLVSYMNDPASYTSSVLDGFVFDTQATPALVNAYAAVSAIQSEYIRPLMHGAYGADTAAKLQEYWDKASASGIEVIRQAVIDQVQAYLDAHQ